MNEEVFFYTSLCDDGSVLVEWGTSHWRFVISLEEEIESFWFMVGDETLGDIRVSGEFMGREEEELREWVESFCLED